MLEEAVLHVFMMFFYTQYFFYLHRKSSGLVVTSYVLYFVCNVHNMYHASYSYKTILVFLKGDHFKYFASEFLFSCNPIFIANRTILI